MEKRKMGRSGKREEGNLGRGKEGEGQKGQIPWFTPHDMKYEKKLTPVMRT